MEGNALSIIDIILILCIGAIVIGTIWIINDAVGALIPTPLWFVIIGLVGVVGIYLFVKIKQ